MTIKIPAKPRGRNISQLKQTNIQEHRNNKRTSDLEDKYKRPNDNNIRQIKCSN
jgi:hypothetical protein